MEDYLLSIGFSKTTKNTFTDQEEWTVVMRGKKADVYSFDVDFGEEFLGTASDIPQLKALLFDLT